MVEFIVFCIICAIVYFSIKFVIDIISLVFVKWFSDKFCEVFDFEKRDNDSSYSDTDVFWTIVIIILIGFGIAGIFLHDTFFWENYHLTDVIIYTVTIVVFIYIATFCCFEKVWLFWIELIVLVLGLLAFIWRAEIIEQVEISKIERAQEMKRIEKFRIQKEIEKAKEMKRIEEIRFQKEKEQQKVDKINRRRNSIITGGFLYLFVQNFKDMSELVERINKSVITCERNREGTQKRLECLKKDIQKDENFKKWKELEDKIKKIQIDLVKDLEIVWCQEPLCSREEALKELDKVFRKYDFSVKEIENEL